MKTKTSGKNETAKERNSRFTGFLEGLSYVSTLNDLQNLVGEMETFCEHPSLVAVLEGDRIEGYYENFRQIKRRFNLVDTRYNDEFLKISMGIDQRNQIISDYNKYHSQLCEEYIEKRGADNIMKGPQEQVE